TGCRPSRRRRGRAATRAGSGGARRRPRAAVQPVGARRASGAARRGTPRRSRCRRGRTSPPGSALLQSGHERQGTWTWLDAFGIAVAMGELRFRADGGCFGCSATHPNGLRLSFDRDGDAIVCRYTIPDRFHGAPGVAHGGIVATILDEVSCAAVFFVRASMVMTGELSVRYVKPCPVEWPLEA